MCQGWEWHIAYIAVYIDRVNTVVVRKTSQHFLSKSFVRNKKSIKRKKRKKKNEKQGARLYEA